MSSPVPELVEKVGPVPLGHIEQELTRQLKKAQGGGEAPALRARLSNLVIFCNSQELAARVAPAVPAIVMLHPARVLFLIGEPGPESVGVTAEVDVRGHQVDGKSRIFTEQVVLRARGNAVEDMAFAVRELLVGDLPTNLLWVVPQPPALAGSLLYDLAENAQQVLYDSIGWTEPARGVAATGAWLSQCERASGAGRWRVVSDLNWRRLKYWRRFLAQTLDPASAPGALESITDVLVEHGPHAVIQAWELVSWLARCLKWRVQEGRLEPGVEITWQAAAPQGPLRLRIRRLAEGPSEVRHVRIACDLDGKPGVLDHVVQEEQRLAVLLEGVEAAPRTMTAPPQSFAELVGRQLSDRERDPVFQDSMEVAQVLARSVLN